MLQIVRSHRLEALGERLAAELADAPLGDPLAAEYVVVHSRGMERWLAQRLAERVGEVGGRPAGVCANVRFPFPSWAVRIALAAGAGREPRSDPWRPERTVWPLLELLSGPLEAPALAPLRAHLGGAQGADQRRLPLARRIADLFDAYALQRPAMVRAWAAGDDVDAEGSTLVEAQRWQPALWRALRARLETPSFAEELPGALVQLRSPAPLPERTWLPERLFLFGLGGLPPAQVGLLDALAERCPVTLLLLTPLTGASPAAAQPPAHPLLAALGRRAVEFEHVLAALPAPDASPQTAPPAAAVAPQAGAAGPPGAPAGHAATGSSAPTLLSALQEDLRADRARGEHADPLHWPAPDGSVQIHAAHGPTRQLEALHDALLALLDADPTLQPRDIVVMTPQVETFAPLVSAVLGASASGGQEADGEGGPGLPYRVADRTAPAANPAAGVVLAVLDLADQRVTASALLDLLAQEPVRRRFALTAADLDVFRRWVRAAGVRWGVDAADRARWQLPADAAHTWRAGLDRLLLGVAMADEDDRTVGGATPFDDVEGSDVELLHRCVAAAETLLGWLAALRAPRPLADWRVAVAGLLDSVVATGEARWAEQELRDACDALVEASTEAGRGPASVPLTRHELRGALALQLEATAPTSAYQSGGVTICGLQPLRGVPHRVVCLLGMDDEAFPRRAGAPSMDLSARSPEPGDRNPRLEDRGLFLDAVLAARDALVVTYTGADPRTNEPRPPATPVSELLDALDVAARIGDGEHSCHTHLVTHHRLQAFSPANFGGEGAEPRSYDTRQCDAAAALAAGPRRPPPFFPAPLPPPADEPDGALPVVTLDDLLRFVANPARFLLTRRLELEVDEPDDGLADRDPLVVEGLAAWELGEELLSRERTGRPRDRWRAAAHGRGGVPGGMLGAAALDGLKETVAELVAAADLTALPPPTSLAVDVTVPTDGGECRLVGSLAGLHGETLCTVQYARLGARHRLRAWVRLLAASAAAPELALHSRLVGRDRRSARVGALGPLGHAPTERLEAARTHLGELVDLYRYGRCTPLPCLPETAAAYAAGRAADGTVTPAARRSAQRAWEDEGAFGGPAGEAHDAAVRQALGALSFDELCAATPFTTLAAAIWTPLLAHEEGPR